MIVFITPRVLLGTLADTITWVLLEGLISFKILNSSDGLSFLIRQIILPGFITTESPFTRAASSQSLLRWMPGYNSYSDLYVDPDADPFEARFDTGDLRPMVCSMSSLFALKHRSEMRCSSGNEDTIKHNAQILETAGFRIGVK